jgi:hypothetical protein
VRLSFHFLLATAPPKRQVKLEWDATRAGHVMDMKHMREFRDEEFDTIIDKGAVPPPCLPSSIDAIIHWRSIFPFLGTLDAVMVRDVQSRRERLKKRFTVGVTQCEQGDVWELEESIAAEARHEPARGCSALLFVLTAKARRRRSARHWRRCRACCVEAAFSCISRTCRRMCSSRTLDRPP